MDELTAGRAVSSTYGDLTDDEQVEALRPVAREAAGRFGLAVERVELVSHAFNTTFAVDTDDGRRYALRVGTNSASTAEHVVAQQEWQRALALEDDVLVARPLATTDGAWFAEVGCEVFGRALLVTAASWLDGPDAGIDLAPRAARALGRTTALLHRQSAGWTLPPGGHLPRLDTPLFGDEDRLVGAPGLTAEGQDVIDEAAARTGEAFARLHDGVTVQAVHADLHGDNVKWQDGRLAVFDFDDCGLGLPVLDLAISTFYLRSGDTAAEESLLAGYAEVAPLPDVPPADVEALMAGRQLLLANSLLITTTAELRSEAAGYLAVSVDRLRHWLTTGTFTRALPD